MATITPPPLPDTTGDCTGVPIGVPPGVDTEKSVGRELIVDRRIALMLDRPAYETDDETPLPMPTARFDAARPMTTGAGTGGAGIRAPFGVASSPAALTAFAALTTLRLSLIHI